MSFIKRFDFFPKVSESVSTRQTAKGGVIFFLFIGVMIALLFKEITDLIVGEPIVEPYIEVPDLEDKTRVNLNISLYDVPCEAVTLDYQDITGTHFEDLEQTMYKLHLNPEGYVIDYKDLQRVMKFESKNFHPSHPHYDHNQKEEEGANSCYGAELYAGQKCYTCEDVQKAYSQRGWPMPSLEMITQCKGYGKRVLMEETQEKIENKTEIIIPSQKVFFADNYYAVENVKNDTVFSISMIRTECSLVQELIMEIEYLDSETKNSITIPVQKLFFRQGECQKFVPFKISAYSEESKAIVVESKLFSQEIKALVQDSKFMKIRLVNMENEETNVMIKAHIPVTANKRMLHAEFYGFDDRQPTIITAEEVQFFRNVLGRGCQIAGTMFLKQVPGNFHISTHHKGGALQWIEKPLTARHTVHFLEFTRENDEVTEGSLGSKIKTNYIHQSTINAPHAHDVEYYLKIVGSKRDHPLWGERSFYEYVAHVNIVPKEKNVILIEFKYEFDPVSMKYTNLRRSLTGFIVSLLAIIGGIFATSTLIDKILGG